MPTLVNQITIGDLIQTLALIIAAVGLFLNLAQMKAANRQKRAEFIIDLHNQFSLDKDVLDIYYKIEYGEFSYEPVEFHGSDEEKRLDKLLDVFDNIAKLYSLNNFTLRDLDYVAYNYLVVYQDESVSEYLGFLDKWYKERGMKVKPYSAFRNVGNTLEEKYFNKAQLLNHDPPDKQLEPPAS
jgi:hypothetical protein